MQPVTDPNILAQLNGGQAAPTPTQAAQPQQSAQGLQPVTDPSVLAQLNGSTSPDKLGAKGGVLDSVANAIPDSVTNSAPFRALAGVGGGLLQRGIGAIQGGAQLLGANDTAQAAGNAVKDINQNLQGAGLAGKAGQIVGDAAPLALAPGIGTAALAEAASRPSEQPQDLGQRATNAALDYAGGKALSAAGSAAMRYLSPEVNTAVSDIAGTTPGNTQANASALQDLVQTQHNKISGQETGLWNKVGEEAANSAIPNKNIGQLQNTLMDAQASMTNPQSAALIDGQLKVIDRFVNGGLDIPAPAVIAMRKALSKASANDGGLRDAVNGVDNFIGQNLNVPSLPDAIATSKSRFQNFVDQKVVAKIADPASTPETVAAKVFNANDPQAADKFNQVLTAVKNTGGDIQAARTHMQQGVANSLLGDAVQGADRSGAPLVNSTKLANNIQDLRTNNQSLWNQLPSGTRQSLSQVEQAQRPYGGVVGLGIKAVKGAANLGLKAAPGVVGDAVNGAMAGESLVPMSKILGQIKMPAGGSALAAEAPVSGPVPPVGAITRSPMGSQQGAARSDAIPVLGGGAAGVAGVSYLANQMRNQGNQPGGNNQQPNPQGQAAMASMPPPPVSAAPTAPISTTMPMHDELGDFIKGLPPAQAVTRTIIANEEGTRPTVYTDKTGHKTVAQGFNMDAPNARAIWKRAGVAENFNDVYKGQAALSNDSINKLTNITTDAAQKAAQKIVPNYDQLGDNQKAALNSLVYQLGSNGLAKFRSMLNYLAQGNSKAVENSLINSRLGQSQAPARTRREAMMLAYNMPHDVADATLASQGRISSTERKYLPQ